MSKGSCDITADARKRLLDTQAHPRWRLPDLRSALPLLADAGASGRCTSKLPGTT